jgi:hypothetical protein
MKSVEARWGILYRSDGHTDAIGTLKAYGASMRTRCASLRHRTTERSRCGTEMRGRVSRRW